MENKLLGTGTYGCVYKPPISCKYLKKFDKKHENDVMKVVDTTIEANILELEISEIIRDIDPKNNYFISFSGDGCLLDDDDELKSCKAYKNAKKLIYIKGYYVKHGGVSLHSYLKNMHKDDISVNILFEWIIHLTKGLKLLHDNNIVHLDIKTDNIVIDKDGNPKFIDFGLSKFASEIQKSDTCYYSLYPLFYTAQCAKIEKLYEEYEPLVIFFDKNYKRGTKTDLILKLFNKANKFSKKYFNNAIKSDNFYLKPKIIPKFNEKAGIFKVDVYMLMHMINDYIYVPYSYIFSENHETKKIQDKIVDCINNGLNVFPDKQYTTGELLYILTNKT